ncbi:hypothetical protein MFIFM68171_08740 [Madurella fahalii]|uniref:Succinate dehydrogenase assembly factor 4, mitochondrial n=1 Tax=Madurella fahalii TaxID=1157608 RepID=A0ABQ0GLA5_9PEZI
MNRLSVLASACRGPSRAAVSLRASAITSARAYNTSSSPKSAEEPSATSGGSRSKEAVETGSSPTAGVIPDPLAEGDMRGRTGGGKPLESSRSAPPQPKISNSSVPGERPKLTEEQKAEVDAHNRDFESKHGRAEKADDDKVDKAFWSGKGSRYNND